MRANLDIETMYAKMSRHIDATANAHITKRLIKSCRLKPYDVVHGSFTYTRPSFVSIWLDEFGNAVDARNGAIEFKSCNIVEQPTSDLFYGRSIHATAKESSFVGIVENDSVISMWYGKDEYFRAFRYDGKKWNRCSPIMVGLDIVRLMIANIDIGEVKVMGNVVMSCLPLRQDIVKYREILDGVF